MLKMRGVTVSLLSLCLSACVSAPDRLGAWVVESAARAPWATDSHEALADTSIYVGQRVTFGADEIQGLGFLTCKAPNYRWGETDAEGLFQGAFAGIRSDPVAAAKRTGFAAFPVRMLSTGCEHDIPFYFRDETHAAFALDNVIFWMARGR